MYQQPKTVRFAKAAIPSPDEEAASLRAQMDAIKQSMRQRALAEQQLVGREAKVLQERRELTRQQRELEVAQQRLTSGEQDLNRRERELEESLRNFASKLAQMAPTTK